MSKKNDSKTKLIVGTSGWQYRHWNGKFYPKDLPKALWLKFYANIFSTVEINSTFYRTPRRDTFKKWRKEVAEIPHFVFAVKLNMYFTRYKKLHLDDQTSKELEEFLSRAAELHDNLGPILIQAPPSLRFNLPLLQDFLKELETISKKLHKEISKPKPEFLFAFEFRHKSWYVKEVFTELKKAHAALVIGDADRWDNDIQKVSDWLYIRFHGTPVLYVSNYSDADLEAWKKRLLELKPKRIYAYFNNDAAGHATENASTFKAMFK